MRTNPSHTISVVAFLLITISSSAILPILVLGTSRRISSYGAINYPMDGYIYVQNGKFYRPDGKRLVIHGANLHDIAYGQTVLLTDKDFNALSVCGINTVRIMINWRFFEPTYQQWNTTYINGLIRIKNLCEKYGIYMVVGLGAADPINTYYVPTWLVKWERIYNTTGRTAFKNVWLKIAEIFKDSAYLLSYDLPWNEPWLIIYNWRAQDAKDLYDDHVKNGFNLTAQWNNWLEEKYDTIDVLNQTWNHSTQDQLSSAENAWGKIKPPCKFQTPSADHWECARMTDFILFDVDLLVNITQKAINAIKTVDTNHIFSFEQPVEQINPLRFCVSRIIRQLPDVSALQMHHYLSESHSYTYFGGGDLLVSESFLNKDVAVYVGEWSVGSSPSNPGSLTQGLLNLAQMGITGFADNGLILWAYFSDPVNKDPYHCSINPSRKTWYPEWSFYPYFMRYWDNCSRRKSDVGIIISQYEETGSFLQMRNLFSALRVTSAFLIEEEIVQDPNVLNDFEAIVYMYTDRNGGFSFPCMEKVRDWAKAGNYILWLAFDCCSNAYFKCPPDDRHPLANYLWEPTSSWKVLATQDDTLEFVDDFGDISSGTTFTYTTWSGATSRQFTSDMLDGIVGSAIRANDNTLGKVALWTVNTSAVFISPLCYRHSPFWYPRSHDHPFLRIARAFLNWSHIPYDASSSFNLQYHFDRNNNFLILYERLGQAGNYYLKLNLKDIKLDPNEKYVTYRIFNWTTYDEQPYHLGSNLRNLAVALKPYQTMMFRVVPYGIPRIVFSNATIKSEVYDVSATKLILSLYSLSVRTSYRLAVSCGDLTPQNVIIDNTTYPIGGDKTSFEPKTRILTITLESYSSADIIVNFSS